MEISTLATSSSTAHAEYLSLSYRPELRTVVLRWLRDTTFPEIQLGHQAALYLARHHAATHWFIDVRRRLLVEHTHFSWVVDDFLPQASALLPDSLRVAYFMSPNRQRIIDSQPELQATFSRSQSLSQPYRMQAFFDEAAALQWLLNA